MNPTNDTTTTRLRLDTRSISRRTALGSVLAAAALLSGCSTSSSSAVSSSMPTSTPSSPSASDVSPTLGTPTSVTIPRMGITDHVVEGLGLASDGSLTPPIHTIQWYTGRVSPGMVGNAILAAHVTYQGKDEFYRLDEMKVGDEVTVHTSTGKTLVFTVTKTESVEKNALTHRQDVWGSSKDKNLVLVSCDAKSGWVDSSEQHHKNNVVVWTTLKA